MAKNLPSTQSHLDIEDIIEDLVFLKNGNYAMILETDSLNFELLSEDEQDAKVLAFSNLLNALNFSIQIVIRTEKADLNDYLKQLVTIRSTQQSLALRKQMEIYIRFINNLLEKTEILNKRFLIVITTNFVSVQTKSLFGGLVGGGKTSAPDSRAKLSQAQEYLNPKRNFLIKQLQKLGLKAVQLDQDQLIQLYYDIYDPDKVGTSKINISAEDYTTGVVAPEQSDEPLERALGSSSGGSGNDAQTGNAVKRNQNLIDNIVEG